MRLTMSSSKSPEIEKKTAIGGLSKWLFSIDTENFKAMGAHIFSGDVKDQNIPKINQKHHFMPQFWAGNVKTASRRCQIYSGNQVPFLGIWVLNSVNPVSHLGNWVAILGVYWWPFFPILAIWCWNWKSKKMASPLIKKNEKITSLSL